MKKKKRIIICSIIIILLIIFAVLFFVKTDILVREEKIQNKDIEHIALVYKYENYASGHKEYVYIIDDDGSVYYEDFVRNANEYIDVEDDLLAMLLDVYTNEDKIEYQMDCFDDSFKEKIYNANYNWCIYEKEIMMDAGDGEYYCLIKTLGEHKLVKLQQSGDHTYRPLNGDYKDICKYIDDIRKNVKKKEKDKE